MRDGRGGGQGLGAGPVATTALATLVVSDPRVRGQLASGERVAGWR
ncbi:hypothetical protein I553_5714 [Mycobacterium xenopi 4042]|uniref:Uncharacterized protein n=1 Tax=Mycobacterium xenopi 4042 TaxID=1299334 RepID=X7ZWD9_MYCXE|nr:hypothetical protein I553_5714 [Mycobacterium xenopi 4042]